ncbi:MAG: ABC transporter permease [Acidobacteriia bacterium]|nr:ABC transporter permease [Terriglobia bacterium]
MKNIWAIARRQYENYFVSPIAYAVLTIFLLVMGYFFYNILRLIVENSMMEAMQSQQFGGLPPGVDVPSQVARNFFGILSTILLFMLPMITMGLFAEEKKQGTLELLMTSPLTSVQIVLGKFLAALAFFVSMLLPTLLYFEIMQVYSQPHFPWGPVFNSFFGILLLGGALLALGSFISSLTENQIIASVSTFGVFLILWVLDISSRSGESKLGEVLGYLSVLNHFEDFSKGIFDTTHLIFYLSFMAFSLLLTLRSLESLRWRQ